METQILSGKLIETFGLEDAGGDVGGIQWFIVETNMTCAGSDRGTMAFSCFSKGHVARHIGDIPKGAYVEVEGTLVLDMEARGESNIWFDVSSVHYEKMTKL